MLDKDFTLPIHWNDYEDIAMSLYEKFGDAFDEPKNLPFALYRFAGMGFEPSEFLGKREESTEGHLEQIQTAWAYEWRDNQ